MNAKERLALGRLVLPLGASAVFPARPALQVVHRPPSALENRILLEVPLHLVEALVVGF